MSRLLLCTDLDRTLLPNGPAPESAGARRAFARLVAHPQVRLVYVTGRHPALVDEAIATWRVPVPDLLIADVGATIVSGAAGRWKRWTRWDETLAGDWAGHSPGDLRDLLTGISGLTPQDPSRQATFKLSYFTPVETAGSVVAQAVRDRLRAAGIGANVIWSMDETAKTGLLDVLPAAATKRLALEFVLEDWDYEPGEVLFAGDSGNDLDVLVSPIPAVLVANADPSVRTEARERTGSAESASGLYLARGGALGMNGNYAAGILEGVLHYYPEWSGLLEEET